MYAKSGVDPLLLSSLSSMQGRKVHFRGQMCGQRYFALKSCDADAIVASSSFLKCLRTQVQAKNVPFCSFEVGKLKAFAIRSHEGQQLVVMPNEGVIAVCQQDPSIGVEIESKEDLIEILEILAREYQQL